uniref:Integrase core domain containing protein n=1 Tax=Solanum tuberosum TaxID=4113 RepID=M1DDF1_SOLTU
MTILPFPRLIFHLGGEVTVPVWGCDRLIEVTKAVDLGLIKDDANPATPQKGIKVDLPPLGGHIDVDQEDEDPILAIILVTDVHALPSTISGQAASTPQCPTT